MIYSFNSNEFHSLCQKKIHTTANLSNCDKKQTLTSLYNSLADMLHISYDSVIAYYRGKNGPGDIHAIKIIAEYFGVDYHKLLIKKDISRKEEPMKAEPTSSNETLEIITNLLEKQISINLEHEDQNLLNLTEKEAVLDIYYAFSDYITSIPDRWSIFYPDNGPDEFFNHHLIPAEPFFRKLLKYKLLISTERYSKIEAILTDYEYFELHGGIDFPNQKITDFYNTQNNTNLSPDDLFSQYDLPIWSDCYLKIIADYYLTQFQQAVKDLF